MRRRRTQLDFVRKASGLYIPKPLRMSPGYPCCCGHQCEFGDGDSYTDNFSSIDPDWDYNPFDTDITGGYVVFNPWGNSPYCTRYACCPTLGPSFHVEVSGDVWLDTGGATVGLLFFSLIAFPVGLFQRNSDYLAYYNVGSYETISVSPSGGDTIKITIDGTYTSGEYDIEFFINDNSELLKEGEDLSAYLTGPDDTFLVGFSGSRGASGQLAHCDNYDYASSY